MTCRDRSRSARATAGEPSAGPPSAAAGGPLQGSGTTANTLSASVRTPSSSLRAGSANQRDARSGSPLDRAYMFQEPSSVPMSVVTT